MFEYWGVNVTTWSLVLRCAVGGMRGAVQCGAGRAGTRRRGGGEHFPGWREIALRQAGKHGPMLLSSGPAVSARLNRVLRDARSEPRRPHRLRALLNEVTHSLWLFVGVNAMFVGSFRARMRYRKIRSLRGTDVLGRFDTSLKTISYN